MSATAFVDQKRRELLVLHLSAHASSVQKRVFLAAVVVDASSLFVDSSVDPIMSKAKIDSVLQT